MKKLLIGLFSITFLLSCNSAEDSNGTEDKHNCDGTDIPKGSIITEMTVAERMVKNYTDSSKVAKHGLSGTINVGHLRRIMKYLDDKEFLRVYMMAYSSDDVSSGRGVDPVVNQPSILITCSTATETTGYTVFKMVCPPPFDETCWDKDSTSRAPGQ